MSTRVVDREASAADVPPPGAELTTRTETVPAFASCAAVSVALRWVASWYVVAAGAPSKLICDVKKKPRPVTTTSVGPEPTAPLDGASDVTCGAGYCTRNTTGAVRPPPGGGLLTDTGKSPAAPSEAAGTVAWSLVPFTKVVARTVPLKTTLLPGTKPEPLTVSCSAAEPTKAADGLMAWTAASGFAIVNAIGADAPPPGAGLKTVTGTLPELTRRLDGIVASRDVELRTWS